MTTTLIRPDVEDRTVVVAETGTSPDEVAHIVYVPADLRGEHTPQSLVLKARVEGTPIIALCGYTWVPSKNPESLPLCAPCKEIHDTTGHDLPGA